MRAVGPIHWFFRGDLELARSYLPEARKHLGVLLNMLDLNDVATSARQIRNKDGIVFRVDRFGTETRITIDTTGGVVGCQDCTLYLETGLLDLGTNSSGDARDQPTVADTAPPMAFGDYTACGGGKPQGFLSLTVCDDGTSSVGGGCQVPPEGAPARIAKATDAVNDAGGSPIVTRLQKKTCQAALQPSLWTGVMHRWMQAMYGNPKAVYRCDIINDPSTFIDLPHLQVMNTKRTAWLDVSYAPYAEFHGITLGTWGIIDLGKCNYRFVHAFEDRALIYQADLTACAKELAGLVGSMPTDTLEQRQKRDRREAYVLSQLTINGDVAPVTITYDTPVDWPLCYGWKFNPRAPEMAMVTVAGTSSPQATLRKRVFSLDTDGNVVITEHDESGVDVSLFGGLWNGMVVPYLDNRTSTSGTLRGFTRNFTANAIGGPQADFDAPIYCWYLEDGTLEVIRVTWTGSAMSIGGDACWPDFDETSNIPNYSTACSVNNPCLQHSTRAFTSGSLGFYSARASSVAVTTWSDTSAQFNSDWQATEYAVTWDTGGRTFYYPSTPPGPVSTPAATHFIPGAGLVGRDVPTTWTWDLGFYGCTFNADTISPHGCPYFDGTFTVDTPGPVTVVTAVCPDIGNAPNGQPYYNTNVSINDPGGSGGFPPGDFVSELTFTPNLGLSHTKTAAWHEQDTIAALLIIPAGSASAAFMLNESVNQFIGASGESATYFLCDSGVSTQFNVADYSATCNYEDALGIFLTTADATSLGQSSAPDIRINMDCAAPGGGWGLSGLLPDPLADGGHVFPEMISPGPVGLGSSGGNYGVESVTNIKLLGFFVDTVVDVADDVDGSFAFPDMGNTGAFLDFAPSCLTNPGDTHEGVSNVPINSLFMGHGLVWPTDAVDFWNVSSGDVEESVSRSTLKSKAAMFVHTSVGGDLAYFADFPALREEYADNRLTLTRAYTGVERPGFIGWA